MTDVSYYPEGVYIFNVQKSVSLNSSYPDFLLDSQWKIGTELNQGGIPVKDLC